MVRTLRFRFCNVTRYYKKLVYLLIASSILSIAGCNHVTAVDQTTQSDATVTPNIIIDGNNSDWSGTTPLATASYQSTASIRACYDDSFLYFCIQGPGMGVNYDLFLNTDNKTGTGFNDPVFLNDGFEFLVENGTLYKSTGPGWSWSGIPGGVSAIKSSSVLEIRIDRSKLGTIASTVTIGFSDVNNSWAVVSRIPKAACVNFTTSDPTAGKMKILVPAYFDPSDSGWVTMATKSKAMPGRIWAIANPNSGPGASELPEYSTVITNMHNNSGKVIGYVSTSFGKRSVAEIIADINKWYSWYAVDGIFLDEFPWETTYASNYQTIYSYIKCKSGSALVVGNPGGDCQEAYLVSKGKRSADVLCVFETYPGYSTWTGLSWYRNYSADNFYILPYNTSDSTYQPYIDRANSNNVKWVYCTDDILPNPWDALASYFTAECDYVISKGY